jgi:hypothetical protein
MSYHTGTAASIEALHTAIVNTCVSEGWTWDSGANILHKGTMFFKLTWITTRSTANHDTIILGGRTALVGGDIPDNNVMISEFDNWEWSYPITYHIFVFDFEVWVAVNIFPATYMHLTFGQSQLPVPGTGNFFAGIYGEDTSTYVPTGVVSVIFGGSTFSTARYRNYYCHDGLHPSGNGWRPDDNRSSDSDTSLVVGVGSVANIIANQPNAFSQESILVPIRCFHAFLSSKWGMVMEMQNARYIRNDYYEDEAIIELGPDRWMIFPFSYKNINDRNKTTAASSRFISGTYAVAVKYEPVE